MITDEEIQSYYDLWHYNSLKMQGILTEMFPCIRNKENAGIDSMTCIAQSIIPLGSVDSRIKNQVRGIVYEYIKERYPEMIFECWMLYREKT